MKHAHESHDDGHGEAGPRKVVPFRVPRRITLRPGYWCECAVYTRTVWKEGRTLSSFEAASPAQAIRWIRVTVRTLVSALTPESAASVYEWLFHGGPAAIGQLENGEPFA